MVRLGVLHTSVLLRCAAIAAVGAAVLALSNPLTTVIAVASPIAYALIASVHITWAILAYRLTSQVGAATLTAAMTALMAAPLNSLGLLLIPGLVLPALTIDLALALLPAQWRPAVRIVLATFAGSLVVFAISLPVIDPDRLQPGAVVAILACRIVGYQLAGLAAFGIFRALNRALGRTGK